jgi:hypothetical protein
LYSITYPTKDSTSTDDKDSTSGGSNWRMHRKISESEMKLRRNDSSTLLQRGNYAVAFYSHLPKNTLVIDIDTNEIDKKMESVIHDFTHLLTNLSK